MFSGHLLSFAYYVLIGNGLKIDTLLYVIITNTTFNPNCLSQIETCRNAIYLIELT